MELCYPGCPNFEALNTKNSFEDVIKTYTPCSSTQCVVNIVDSLTSLCTSCSFPASRRIRLLEDSIYGSSEVTFEIVSNTTLIQQVVRKNLNSNIANINSDLNRTNATILVISRFTAVTIQPTKKPSSSVSYCYSTDVSCFIICIFPPMLIYERLLSLKMPSLLRSPHFNPKYLIQRPLKAARVPKNHPRVTRVVG